ncbi:enoyl-CoA hydratase/isomerase family protein [Sphingomonas kyeonggiensis]|uniref:Enoyl-CoA hydratase/carnithine racemase n=1 Tax=Sphingomonas kyeonggiensis TaxID=1268553 RepID=A0A7W6JRJ9_9SPHN|nr:enoyl-CoA hydratase/isomerase family protein [Sphingomonas kyeonggiensis]MBB4098264.1 enoyl-CoA hydratase/carnithine racemase [Sphingomonas kyeonggiensis]
MPRQIQLQRPAPGLLRATFDHPPINLIDPDTIGELAELIGQLETDPEARVIVFDSADPDFFLAHYDVLADKARTAAMAPGPTGMHLWLDVLVRIARAPVASIAMIRGRARGAGSEFALACDMRFASAERAILGQFEMGVGVVPGGNPMARLAGLMGRGRTLEVVLGADDFPGPLAERYGYVNRALPDGELDTFVDRLARRLAGFDKQAIASAKRLVDAVSLPDDAVFPQSLAAYFETVQRPVARERSAALVRAGLQTRSAVEMELGKYVAFDRDA